jgi:hypothetical protein
MKSTRTKNLQYRAGTLNHEEARRTLSSYLNACSADSSLNVAIRKLLADWGTVYNLLEGLAELNNTVANRRLADTGKFDEFTSPLTVELVRKMIQEL